MCSLYPKPVDLHQWFPGIQEKRPHCLLIWQRIFCQWNVQVLNIRPNNVPCPLSIVDPMKRCLRQTYSYCHKPEFISDATTINQFDNVPQQYSKILLLKCVGMRKTPQNVFEELSSPSWRVKRVCVFVTTSPCRMELSEVAMEKLIVAQSVS